MNTKHRTLAFRILPVLGLVLTLAATSVQTARAMEIDNDGQVGADEVINDDLVLTDENVTMAGTVNGTLIAMGSNVVVSGTVNGDLIAFGSTVTVTGTVTGNVFTGGGDVQVDGSVENSLFFGGNALSLGPQSVIGGNLYGAGFSIELQAGARIVRDAAVGGYQVILAGEVGRDVRAGVAAFELTGKVGRNVIVDVGEPDGDNPDAEFFGYLPFAHVRRLLSVGLHIESTAVIGGRLEYSSAVEQTAEIRATPEGGVVYHYRAPQDGTDNRTVAVRNTVHTIDFVGIFSGYIFTVIRDFLTLVLLGALAVWLIPSLLTRTAGVLRAQPLPALGWGFLVLVVGLIGLVIAAMGVLMLGIAIGVVTLFGLMAAIFGIGFSAVGLSGAVFVAVAQYGSKLVVALLLGDWILRLFRKDYSAGAFWPLLLGITLLVLVEAVPILGWVASVFVICFGFGAIWLVFRDGWRNRKASA
jgi:hypothetical protein